MKIQAKPASKISVSVKSPAKEVAAAQVGKSAWSPKSAAATSAGAKALKAVIVATPELASRIISTVAKRSDLARELNWEAGHIKSVKPNLDGKSYSVEVQLDVLKGKKIEKNLFYANVNSAGKVLNVPQG